MTQNVIYGYPPCVPYDPPPRKVYKPTKKELAATEEARAMAAQLGPKWEPIIWLHYGWHVTARKDNIEVEKVGDTFHATYRYRQGEGCYVTAHASTPKKAMRNLVYSIDDYHSHLAFDREVLMHTRNALAKSMKMNTRRER